MSCGIINNIEQRVKELARCKNDIVFVGGIALGKTDANDIDIAVTSLDGLSEFGEIYGWESKSCLAIGAERYAIKPDIDIWLYKELPEYKEIDGIKYQTESSMLEHYKEALEASVYPELTNLIKEKIKLLIKKTNGTIRKPTRFRDRS